MNSYKIIEIIKQNIIQSASEINSPLRGISVETDPYAQLENRLPFILIEEGVTQLVANPQGCVLEYLHSIELTLVLNAAKEERGIYKMKVSALAENILKTINAFSDYRFKIIPKEMKSGELIAGSVKCSGVKLTIEVKSLFVDE